MFDFLRENFSLLLSIIIFLSGWLLPTPKFILLGKKTREKLPPIFLKLIEERLEAFLKGLLDKEYRGNRDVVGNMQLRDAVKDLKFDLGLKE